MARKSTTRQTEDPSAASEGTTKREISPFARVLIDLRTARGLSQAKVAELAECSVGYIGLIENGMRGSRPRYEVVRKFAQALSLNVEDTEQLMRAAGHLGPDQSMWSAGDEWTTERAINSDPMLDANQKEILIGVYANMVRGSVRRPKSA